MRKDKDAWDDYLWNNWNANKGKVETLLSKYQGTATWSHLGLESGDFEHLTDDKTPAAGVVRRLGAAYEYLLKREKLDIEISELK
jgi:hypothetical protein